MHAVYHFGFLGTGMVPAGGLSSSRRFAQVMDEGIGQIAYLSVFWIVGEFAEFEPDEEQPGKRMNFIGWVVTLW